MFHRNKPVYIVRHKRGAFQVKKDGLVIKFLPHDDVKPRSYITASPGMQKLMRIVRFDFEEWEKKNGCKVPLILEFSDLSYWVQKGGDGRAVRHEYVQRKEEVKE